jgi:hypothetical protein
MTKDSLKRRRQKMAGPKIYISGSLEDQRTEDKTIG